MDRGPRSRRLPPPIRCAVFAALVGIGSGLVGCGGSDAPATPSSAGTTLSGAWVARSVLGKDVSGYRIGMDLSDSGGFVVWQTRVLGEGSAPDTLLAGRIREWSGARARVEWTGGSKASRNPEGWVRLERRETGAFLSMISRRATGTGSSSAFPAGTWRSGSWPGGAGTLELADDGIWRLATTRSDSGTWTSGILPDARTLLAQGGVDSAFAGYLAGRTRLVALSSAFLVEGDASEGWFDQIGDGTLVWFVPSTPQ